MDAFEFNKMAAALLSTLLFCMGLGVVSNGVFSHAKMVKAGYELPAAAENPAPGGAPAAPQVPFPNLLAKADPKKGADLAKQCATCHTLAADAAPKPTGPDLAGVIGRKMGSTQFAYSDEMKSKSDGVWTYEKINTFITAPKAYIPGTKMGFAGEKDPQKRADIIAFLHTISPNAPPPPAPEAAPATDQPPKPDAPAAGAAPKQAPEQAPPPAK